AEPQLVEALADLGHRHRLLVANLDQGPAGEVDAVVEAAVQDDRGDGQQHRAEGDAVEPVAFAYEVVVGVDEDLEHRRPRSRSAPHAATPCTSGRRSDA